MRDNVTPISSRRRLKRLDGPSEELGEVVDLIARELGLIAAEAGELRNIVAGRDLPLRSVELDNGLDRISQLAGNVFERIFGQRHDEPPVA